MFGRVRQSILPMAVCILFAGFAQSLVAQAHIVSPSDLQRETLAATQTRQNNVDTLNRFLSSPQAEKAMQDARINPQEVRSAVSNLSDEELANLSSRASKAQNDFAAGTLSERDFLWIILAIAVLILLIVVLR